MTTSPTPAAGSLVRATHERYVLAEGPTWDPVREELLWVDVEAGLVVAGILGADGRITVRETVALGETVGAVAVTETGDWVIAGAERLYVRSPDGGLRPGRRILPPGSGRRLNDGKPDPAGRFVVGTLSLTGDDSVTEELFLVRDDGLELIDADLTLSNGLAWSADGGTLYSVDTVRRVVNRRPSGSGRRVVRRSSDPPLVRPRLPGRDLPGRRGPPVGRHVGPRRGTPPRTRWRARHLDPRSRSPRLERRLRRAGPRHSWSSRPRAGAWPATSSRATRPPARSSPSGPGSGGCRRPCAQPAPARSARVRLMALTASSAGPPPPRPVWPRSRLGPRHVRRGTRSGSVPCP